MSSSNLWVGGYTEDMSGTGTGIRLLKRIDDGTLEDHGLAAATDSPSYLTRAGDVIYATNEGSRVLSAFRVAGDELRFLGLQSVAGDYPCALAVVGNRSLLVAACYGNGAVDVFPLIADGTLAKRSQSLRGDEAANGPDSNQEGPHAHDALQVDDRIVLTADLGTDRVYVHEVQDGALSRIGSVSLPAGAGPRDLFLHPSGAVWVLGELSGHVFVLTRSGDAFEASAAIEIPGAEPGDHAAGLALSSDGRHLYTALRGTNRIGILRVLDDGATLKPLTFVDCGGGWPRHLIVDGSYLHVANQLSNSIATFVFGVDGVPLPHSTISVDSPTYLLLD
jgi:6-phosphogluconolactonase